MRSNIRVQGKIGFAALRSHKGEAIILITDLFWKPYI